MQKKWIFIFKRTIIQYNKKTLKRKEFKTMNTTTLFTSEFSICRGSFEISSRWSICDGNNGYIVERIIE